MIIPDIILFFNRLERTYVSQDFDYLKEHVHPGISFDLLEAALTGNAPGYLMEQKAQLWRTSGGYRLEGAEAFFTYLLNRSEEHTSELQSLMRISYAVFCLKKKNTAT